MRSWTAELDSDSRLAMNPLSDRDYTALLLRLIPHVCHEQPLAARDPGLQPQQRPVLVDFKCLGLFVERLLFRVPAVNKQGYTTRRTLAFPPLGGVSFRGFFARFVGILYGVPWSDVGPFSFSFFQGIPDAAHWTLPKSSMCFGNSVKDSLRGESRTGNVQVSFRLGNPSKRSLISVSLAPSSCRTTPLRTRRPIRISSRSVSTPTATSLFSSLQNRSTQS